VGVLLMASVASASSIWMQAPGGGTDISVVVGDTAIVEIWFEFDGPKHFSSQGDGYGNALMAGVSAFLRANAVGTAGDEHFNYWTAIDGDWASLSPPQTGYGGTLADPFTGGMANYYGTGRNAPEMTAGTSIDLYELILQAPPGAPTAPFGPPETGWIAGLPSQARLDEVVIKGTGLTPAGDPDELYFDIVTITPTWHEQKIEEGDWTAIIADRPLSILTDAYSYYGPPISVTVIPEPGALAVLAIGGLALMRRRR